MKRFFAGFVLLAVAGCAGTQVREGAVTIRPEDTVVELRAGSYFFTPPRLSVPAGRPAVVRIYTEPGLAPHSFVLEGRDGAVLVHRDLVKGGDTLVRLPVLSAGTYSFFCGESFFGKTHRERGMEGELAVTPSGRPGE